MKKLISLLLVGILALSLVSAVAEDTTPYAVTEPITIQWWHAHEDQFDEHIKYMVDEFQKQYPNITVEAIYSGSYGEINEAFVAAVAAGEVPALVTANTSYPAVYGSQGLAEDLTPYIEAYNYDLADFGEGLIASTSYEGQQVSLPYLISTQVMYYDKTAAEEEGIEMPKTFNDLEAFLEKATLFNEDGTTKRYGTVFGGWDYWYYETLFKNNGVETVLPDGKTTDVNSEESVAITTKMKEWIDKGYAYYAYGTNASTDMRNRFGAGEAFSVFHTSSLYDTYVNNIVNGAFEVGMAWLPGGNDGETFKSEVGGAAILIPAKASQAQKNAAWQFLMFMTSPEINLYWADKTGYFPTRQTVKDTPEYKEYLERKPAMEPIVEMSSWINPRNQHPAYNEIANLWRDRLSSIFNENAPIQATLDELAEEITELLEDY